MDFKKSIPLLQSLVIPLILLFVHKFIFYLFFAEVEANFHFSLIELYAFFTATSFVIVLLSIITARRNINIVGQVFLLSSFLQIVLCFVVFYTPLNAEGAIAKMEKANFLIVFLLFLAMETILTVRLLNKT